MIPTSIQLTEEQVQRLKLLANKEHVSTAELVRRAVYYWLQTTQVTPPVLTDEQRR